MKKLNQDHSGFTIIEVVLVLAIAGLIFMMVFIALPALQRNQRDIQRKNDVNRALAALQRYQANNKGNLPSGEYWEGFTSTYLRAGGDVFQDPDGSDYGFWRNPDSGWRQDC
jgi:prepilin-type N-terminal cleavage/methylation domain-containing protein